MKDLSDSIFEGIASFDKGDLIIVEGVNDFKALIYLGVENSILAINGQPLYKVVEASMKYKKVMLLVDFDKEGKKIYSYLYQHLSRFGVKINNNFREFLFKKTSIKTIEELGSYVRNILLRKSWKDGQL